MKPSESVRVAVLVPCFNEGLTIASVVNDFKTALPHAQIYVFDNNSTDDTVIRAREAGATVRRVEHQGKGNVIRRMFADVDADAYVLVDGDDTYDATSAPTLVETLFTEGLDMIVGARTSDEREAYRLGHRLGNKVLTGCVATIFGRTFTDMLSGYRIFSRRYVKSYPAHAAGFETETELTVHALELRMPVAEFDTRYRSRPEGSTSKLNTYRDGWRILLTIIKLLNTERPLLFFSCGFAACAMASILLGLPLLRDYLITGLVPRLPTVVLCVALKILGFVLFTCGIILDAVTHGRREAKRQAYLDQPAPSVDFSRVFT